MQQKKAFDPRNNAVINPFVQNYLDKQTERSKPLSERQKLLNLLLVCGMMLNLGIMGVVAWSLYANSTNNTVQAVTLEGEQAFNMGEAMEKIRSMEAAILSMRNSVELHRNAYYKIETEHETLKSVVAQAVPVGTEKDVAANYMKTSAIQALPNPQLESPEAQEVVKQSRATMTQETTMAIKISQ